MIVEELAPLIREILESPDTDLSTVSAKRVRKRLIELRSEVTTEYVREHKDELDALITKIFRSLEASNGVSAEDNGSPADSQEVHSTPALTGKRKRGQVEAKREEDSDHYNDHDSDEEGNKSQSPRASVTKKPKKASQKLTDEEYARQLSSELNQRPSRASRNSNGPSKKNSNRAPKKTKSRAKIEDSDEGGDDYDNDDNGAKRRKTRSRKSNGEAKGGFSKELTLSEPLAAVVEATQLSRPQVVKRLWQYIKAKELQNPKNKKEILCDASFRAIFNTDKIDMFTMNKVLSQHLYEVE